MMNELRSKIKGKKAKIGIIGLGYVGLPLAVEFAKKGFDVTGFENDKGKISEIQKGCSYILDVPSAEIKSLVSSEKLSATSKKSLLNKMDVIIICVPTPLRKTKEPDISFILSATEDIAANIRKGQLVILESTTYPGTTEEVILTKLSADGLKVGKDFCLAFSPERVDPGNPRYKTKDIPKVVGGVGETCTEIAKLLYSQIIKEVIAVSSTRSAEMVKLLENTFRAVNIGLINELAIMCNKMNLDIWEIIDAAKTKPFGFMPFYPGPGLGGHCLSREEYILIKNNNRFDFMKIGDIFSELKQEPTIKKVYYKDILFIFPEDLHTLSIDMKTKNMIFKKIKCLTERDYEGKSFSIKTEEGRVIKVTDKHPLLMQNGKLSMVLAKDLKPKDELPLMNHMPDEAFFPKDAKNIDIAEHIINSDNPVKDKIRVELIGSDWKQYREIITPLLKNEVRDYHECYRTNQIPFKCYALLKNKLKGIGSEKILLCTGRGPSLVKAPAFIRVDEGFCRLIGYYLSEGCVTSEGVKATRVRFSFNRDEKEYTDDLKSILGNMGFRCSEYNSRKWHSVCIKVSSFIFGILIRDILMCGVDSYTMKVPDALLRLPLVYRRNILAGLLRGDGGVDYIDRRRVYRKNNRLYNHKRNYLSVNYFTCSEKLKNQVIFLLHSIGVIPTFKKNGLINIFGPDNIAKLKDLITGDKGRKIEDYFKRKIKFPKSKLFKDYGKFVTSRIKEIKEENLKKVYSLEVEDTNTFVSSYGIISHNCLPCDPIYLSWKARSHGIETRLIDLAAEVNSFMPAYVVCRIADGLNRRKKALKGSKILIVGVTYKKDINDMRESPSLGIINSLIEKGAEVQYYDPLVPDFKIDGLDLRSVKLTKENISSSDCVAIITDHTALDYALIVKNADLILDTRNALKEFKTNDNIITL